MSVNWLKSVQQQKFQSLTDLLEQRLPGWDPARSIYTINASALTNEDTRYCARERALLHLTKAKPKDRYIKTALRLTFDIGEAYHDLIRNQYLRNDAVGHWECGHCKTLVEFSKVPKAGCKKCGGSNFSYREVRFTHPSGASGGMDLIVDVGQPLLELVEIKSLAKDEFKNLKFALAEHRVRTVLYLHTIRESGHPWAKRVNTSSARILYVSKGFGVKDEYGQFTPFKEFVVTPEDADVSPYFEWAEATSMFFKTGKMPDRICAGPFDKRAKSCGTCGDCFSGWQPGEIYEQGIVHGGH